MKKYFNNIHYSNSLNIIEKAIKSFLSIFSSGYYIGIQVRNFLYKKNVLKQVKLPAYVISVGNLTTGGTGKTPITVEIANHIHNKLQRKVAVLSHGYGGRNSVKEINLISDGKNIYSTPYLAGDEPYWIATNSKHIPVITGKNRVNTGKYTIDQLGAQVLILDDGYQHIKLKRDLNILVIDCYKKFGNSLLLPAGPLREPLSEIKRADKIIVVNKQPFDEYIEATCQKFIEMLKQKYNKPVYSCNIKAGKIYNILTSVPLKDNSVSYSFAGIAQPEFFFNYLKSQNISLTKTREFTDHHLYTEDDLKNIVKEAKKLETDSIITTEKDAVKLLAFIDKIELDIPIYALKLELDLDLDSLLDEIKNENTSNKI